MKELNKTVEQQPKAYQKNGVEYLLDEKTQTYLPQLGLEEAEPIGKYGSLRRTYLMEHRNTQYQILCIKGTLFQHLHEIDQQARKRLEILIPQLMKAQGVTEELKKTDQMKWVGMMENIYSQADEMIFSELIYN